MCVGSWATWQRPSSARLLLLALLICLCSILPVARLAAQSTPPSSTPQQPDDLWSALFQGLDALGPTISDLETSTSSTVQSSADLAASSQASEQGTAALESSSATLQSQQEQASQVLTQQQSSIASSSTSANSSMQSITAVQDDLALAEAAVKRMELENGILKVVALIAAAMAAALGIAVAVK